MPISEKLADKHTQKLNIAFLTELGGPAAHISEALDEVHGKDALSASSVHRIRKAVKDGDDSHRPSAIRRIWRDTRATNLRRSREQQKSKSASPIIHTFPIRALVALTGLSQKVIQSILKRLNMVKKFGEFVSRTPIKTLRRQRCCACAKNLSLLERDGSLLERATTEDEC